MEALLKIGTFGVHVIDNPAGTFSFVGEVPTVFKHTSFPSYAEAVDSFVKFFKSQSVNFQRENIGNLRNDIFVKVMEF